MNDNKKQMDVKLHKILKERLANENISQIARKLNIPKQRLHDWVGAKRYPNFKNVGELKKLANYFGLSLDALLFGYEDKKVLTCLTFEDDGKQYKVLIERLK